MHYYRPLKQQDLVMHENKWPHIDHIALKKDLTHAVREKTQMCMCWIVEIAYV